jgi:site-specific recombinase XerD
MGGIAALYAEIAMRIDDAMAQFLDDRRARLLAPNSLARYAASLTLWQRYLAGAPAELADVQIDHFRGFLTYLLDEHIPHVVNPKRPATAQPGMAPASVVSTRTVLRAFWTFAGNEGWLSEAQQAFFRGDRIPKPRVEEQDRPFWNDALVDDLLDACDRRPREEIARNKAMICLIYESGLRIHELCTLTDDLCDLVDRSARIVGKGGKRRWVFWGDKTADVLAAYLAVRRGPRGGPLFRSVSPRNDGGPLAADSVRQQLKQIAKNAGVELPRNAPVHSGRHGFAHAMIDGGAEISQVSQLMGHANVNTTMRYLREGKDKLQEIHRQASERRKRKTNL